MVTLLTITANRFRQLLAGIRIRPIQNEHLSDVSQRRVAQSDLAGGRGLRRAGTGSRCWWRRSQESRIDLDLVLAIQKARDHVEAEGTIDLELLFIKELVASGLMREAAVASGIVAHVVILVAGQRGLCVDENSVVAIAVKDRADRDMRTAALLGVAFRFGG